MATLVTGGTGFGGSNIVKGLAERGHEVICFDLVAPDALLRKYLEPWSDRIRFLQGDILKVPDLERAAASTNITKVVHAAVFTGIRLDIEKERSRNIVDVNVAGTANRWTCRALCRQSGSSALAPERSMATIAAPTRR
jgi:nucleoside-diphosphate-sugar epimerase